MHVSLGPWLRPGAVEAPGRRLSSPGYEAVVAGTIRPDEGRAVAFEIAVGLRAILTATTAVEKSSSTSAIVVPATLPPGDTIAATGAANTGASTHRGETPARSSAPWVAMMPSGKAMKPIARGAIAAEPMTRSIAAVT